jgi:cytochrome c peroxidase
LTTFHREASMKARLGRCAFSCVFIVASAWSMPILADSPERLAPRPERTADERKARADELRRVYAADPSTWPAPHVDPDVKWKEIGLLPEVEHPADNPHTTEKETLGKTLFFDPRLSGSGQIACASCHDPDLAWGDGRTVSFGHSRTELKRNAPTLTNVGHQTSYFWDGRADSLEAQVEAVLLNVDEMRSEPAVIIARLAAIPGYREPFRAAFGDEAITFARLAQAIAAFERSIVTRANKFDGFAKGGSKALSDSALRGLHLFRTEGRCVNCHLGPNFTDNRFHNLGLSRYGRSDSDLGRYLVTNKPEDVGAFKTPTLRNVLRSAPYMHNGAFDLDETLRLYNAGMITLRPRASEKDDPLFPKKSPLLKPLGLNAHDLADLREFLESLTESNARVRVPALPQ